MADADPSQQQAPASGMKVLQSGAWSTGVDSWSEASSVAESSTRWNVNTVGRGGSPRTRPGFNCIPVSTIGTPRGLTVFTPASGIPHLVIAIGSQVLINPYPFTGNFTSLSGISFSTNGPVIFKSAVQNVTEADDGTLTLITPKQVLMMADGQTRTAYWDGTISRHLDPTKEPSGPSETPPSLWMEWSGNRLWTSDGARVRASNLANPLKFTEEDVLEEGGSLTFPDQITGMGQTPDFKSLLVFTDQTTSSVQSNILDRTQWGQTPGFQTVVFPNIGCAAGKSIVVQYGVTWWFSHGGLIGLDQSIQTYRTSRIHFQDQAMNWSKINISQGCVPNICGGTFENYLFYSVPSGDIYNAHTWVMDESWGLESAIDDVYSAVKPPRWDGLWTGIRPAEWITATVKGKQRCFCLSYDYPPTGSNIFQNNVWEAFINTRIDCGRDFNGVVAYKSISSSVETRLLGNDGTYKKFRFIELDIQDISGVVNLTVSYAGKRGGYKNVLEKQIVASEWDVVNGQTTIAVDTFSFDSFRAQTRTVRTNSDQNQGSDDNYAGVENKYNRQNDYAFSALIQWTGQMSVRAIRLFTDAETQDVEGTCEPDELTDRHVRMDGLQFVDSPPTTPPSVVDGLQLQSDFVSSNTRVWVEVPYVSLT